MARASRSKRSFARELARERCSGRILIGNRAIEASVPGPIYFAHAARTQRRLDFVGTEFRAGGQSHECAQL